jgi:hypothetical protein
MFHGAQVARGRKGYNHTKYNGLNEQTNYFADQPASSGSSPSDSSSSTAYSSPVASATLATASTAPAATEVPLLPLADLVLIDLRVMEQGNGSELGPLFQMTIANQGPSASPSFQATIVAAVSKEQLDIAVNATAQVGQIQPGRSTQVEVRLPVEAMALQGPSGPTMFELLGVALDVLNQVDELDEQNNRGLVNRGNIRPIDSAPATPTAAARAFASQGSDVPSLLSLPRQ